MRTEDYAAPSIGQHRGYYVSYRTDEPNHCPGCSRQNWIVGRLAAECAFCGTAVLLINVHGFGGYQRITCRGRQDMTALPFMPPGLA